MNLIGGQPEIVSPAGILRIGNVLPGKPCRHSPELEFRKQDGTLIWKRRLDGLEENSLSECLSSSVSDFLALLVASKKALLLAGNNKVMVIDLGSGGILGEAPLLQTDSSLDTLELREISSGAVLAISAKRIVVFSQGLSIQATLDFPGPIMEVKDEGNSLIICRFDVEDPQLPRIEERIRLDGLLRPGSPADDDRH